MDVHRITVEQLQKRLRSLPMRANRAREEVRNELDRRRRMEALRIAYVSALVAAIWGLVLIVVVSLAKKNPGNALDFAIIGLGVLVVFAEVTVSRFQREIQEGKAAPWWPPRFLKRKKTQE
jgi:hypothetical protein